MDVETKIDMIMRPPTEEIITINDLRHLLETNEHPTHYIGFEISGLLHIGTLLICGYKINDLVEAGVKTQVYLADYHSFINNKLGGNWDNILKASKYFGEGFNFLCPKAKIVLGSDLYRHNDEYWKNIIRFTKHVSLARNARCLTIMGRNEGEKLDFAQYLYPPMQSVDVKTIGADIPHGGMDQRKAHVLAREVFPRMGWEKPVALHHHLLKGLSEPIQPKSSDKLEQVIASKMSKSKPWTALFIHDSEEEIMGKLEKAWCPERVVEMNPVIEIVKHIIFHEYECFEVERPSKFGGDIAFNSYEEFEKEFIKGNIHPQDLKSNVSRVLNEIISPVRKHFEKPANKKLLKVFEEDQITR